MPTERMEEVEVRMNEAEHLGQLMVQRATPSDPYLRFTAEPEPGSLTSARLRLADAAERLDKAAKATTWCHTVFGTEEECAAWYAKVGYTEADALAVEEECYAARTEYDLALAALRTARGEG